MDISVRAAAKIEKEPGPELFEFSVVDADSFFAVGPSAPTVGPKPETGTRAIFPLAERRDVNAYDAIG